MITYLNPKYQRNGSPAIFAIAKDELGYWLVTFHDLQNHSKYVKGTKKAYSMASYARISESLYRALKSEAFLNRRRYAIKATGSIKCTAHKKGRARR